MSGLRAWWSRVPFLIVALMLALSGPVLAVQPDEVLEDPTLEDRARELSKDLRCLVCQNESIDDSNAPLARELRIVVRERLVVGDSDEDVIQFLVERYGEFVLLRPRTGGWNIILWLSGPVLFLIALGVGTTYIRGRSTAAAPLEDRLSTEEEARLKEILKDS